MNRFEMTPPQEPESVAVQESPDLFDYQKIKDYTLFVLGAAQRHKPVVAVVSGLVVAITGTLLWALPKTYSVETRLLGQRNQVISSLAVPSRAMPYEADAPARAARETIQSRESLLTLMKQTDVVDHFYSHRSPAGKLKDWILVQFGRAPSEDDKREAVLGLLQQRLAVTLSSASSWQAEGTVVISVLWPDPKMAYQLVKAAQENFRDARQVLELSQIRGAISILEGYAAQYRADVDDALEQLEDVRAAKASRTGRPLAPGKVRRRLVPNPEFAKLRSMIDGKQRTIAELEDIRQRRLADLRAQLAELRKTYAEGHPAVLETRQAIQAAEVESPQVTILRRELNEDKAEFASRGGPDSDVFRADPLSPDIAKIQAAPREDDSGEEYLKRYLLQQAVGNYAQMQEKIHSAKIELDASQAAFKYRYTVLYPAMQPNEPIRPKLALTLGAGAIAALFMALFAAVAIDIRSGEILERWQVERQLKLPVLSELPWP
jgi:uncharacterized protein involved in exopolysaccharide biosynthesis